MSQPLWIPKSPERSLMAGFLQRIKQGYDGQIQNYNELQQWSIDQPEAFWSELAEFLGIQFEKPASQILKTGSQMQDCQWFVGAKLNYSKNLLLGKNPAASALICRDENGQRRSLSYGELRVEVAACRAGLIKAGIKPLDRVAAILPNLPETLIIFLAAASIGAIFASCATDFGLEAILDRLGQIEPKILFSSPSHQYQGKLFNDRAKAEQLYQQLPSLEHWVELASDASPKPAIRYADFIVKNAVESYTPLDFDHPLYLLFSSGTTGRPKCILHRAGGALLQQVKELGLHCDLQTGDRLFFYSSCGWMMWNWSCSALQRGASLLVYEGAALYPDSSQLLQIVHEEQVTVFGASAKYLAALEKAGFRVPEDWDLSRLRCLLSTGSPLLAPQYDWVYQNIKTDLQLSSISGGTDIVSCFALGNPILPVYRGEIQCLGLGMAVAVYDEQGQPISGQRGELVCERPFPSMPLGFWQDPNGEKYRQAYFNRFPGVWAHGDFAEISPHQGLIIYGRSDAILNPGGVRIGTAEIYRQLSTIPEIQDSIVIGQDWQDDVRIVLFVQLQAGHQLDAALEQRIKQTLRERASPRHVPAKILQVQDIPRTINNKPVELAVKQCVENRPIQNWHSIANPEALAEFKNRRELSN